MSDDKYKVSYSVLAHSEGVTIEERFEAHKKKLEEPDVGVTDALLIMAVLREPSGASSTAIISKDGATGSDLDDNELFTMWSFLAKQLSESTTLHPGKKALAAEVFEIIRLAVVGARRPGG